MPGKSTGSDLRGVYRNETPAERASDDEYGIWWPGKERGHMALLYARLAEEADPVGER